jgi:hypothetical protein
VLFIIFLLLGIFVLLNMFIAIIGEAYSSTKDDMKREAVARKISNHPSAQDLIQLYMKHMLFTMKPHGTLAAALNTAALKKRMTSVASMRWNPAAVAGGGGVAGGMMGGVNRGALGLRHMFGGGGGRDTSGAGGAGDEAGKAADDALAGEAARLREAGEGNGPGEANVKAGSGEEGDAAAPVAVDVLDKAPDSDGGVTTVEPFAGGGDGDVANGDANGDGAKVVKVGPFGLPLESTGVGFDNGEAAEAARAPGTETAPGGAGDGTGEGGVMTDVEGAAAGMMNSGVVINNYGRDTSGGAGAYNMESGGGGGGGGIDLVNGLHEAGAVQAESS